MNDIKKKQSPVKTLLFGILMMAICILSAKYVLFTALLLPFIGAYATAKLPPSWSLVYYIAAAATCFLLLSEIWIAAFFMLLLSSLLTGIAVKRKQRTYEGVLLSCVGWVLAFAVIIAASYFTYGTDPLTMIVEKIRLWTEQSDDAALLFYIIRQSHDLSYASNSQLAAAILTETQEVLLSGQFDTMRQLVLSDSGMMFYNNIIAQSAPTSALQLSLLGGLFSYLLTRYRIKRSGEEVSPVPAFKDFKLPRNLTTPLAIVFVLSFAALHFIELPAQLYTALLVLVNACTVVFAVQAVTLINWFISLRSQNKGTIIALTIVVSIAAVIFNFLPWLGFFEMLFKLRYNVIVRSRGDMPPGKQ